MNQRKLNMVPWYSLGLTAVLVVLCLLVATGTAWARYRTETANDLNFSVRTPLSVYLGKVKYDETAGASSDTETGKFVQTNEADWTWNEDGQLELSFAVANGTADDKYEKRDQQVSIQVISSLGIQTGEQPLTLKLKVPKKEEPTEETTEPTTEATTEPPTEETTETQPEEEPYDLYEAKAVSIAAGSSLHTSFGEGWVFRFVDEDEEELSWLLEGGALNYAEMSVVMEGGTPADTSLLQLRIDTTYIPE